jgi:hypothetical protein
MSGCKCIAKEEAFAFEFARWRRAKINGSLYQDAAGKRSAGGQWEIDANQAIFPPLTQDYSRVSRSFAVTEILLSDA